MSRGLSRPAGGITGELDQPAANRAGHYTLSPVEAPGVSLPYPPSWIDKFIAWADRLPLPAWAVYLALGTIFALAYLPFLMSTVDWAKGVLDLNTALLYSALNGMTCAYILALIHYLDILAASALARFRPVLAVDDAGYNILRYQITTLPARPTLIASGLGALYTAVVIVIDMSAGSNSGYSMVSTPALFAVAVAFSALIYILAAVLVYHTLHQLHMVNVIYTKHTRINVFRLGPLYALSGLTARTAIGIGIPTYIWFQANSLSAHSAPVSNIIQTILLSLTVIATFVWPLVGAHNLLEKEKQRLQDSLAGRIESVIDALNSRVDTGTREPATMAELQQTLDALVIEQGVVDRLRTWPWRTGTLSGVGVAFILPLVIWIVQRLLERFGI